MPRSAKPSGRRRGHRAADPGPPRCQVRFAPPIEIIDKAGWTNVRQRAAIEREARKLATFAPRLLAIRVEVTAPHRRLDRRPINYQIRVRVAAPLGELVTMRQRDPDLMVAVRAAFKAARRQLRDYVQRHREPRLQAQGAALGRVLQLSPWEGYGFIAGSDHEEVYFERSSVVNDRFDRLHVGQAVRYAAAAGREGLRASTVDPVGRAG